MTTTPTPEAIEAAARTLWEVGSSANPIPWDEVGDWQLDRYRMFATAALIAAGYTRPRTITTVAEAEELPRNSVVSCITHSSNIPIVITFQRGSNEHGGMGWTTPEAIGQISTEQMFEFIGLNCLPTTFTILHEGAGA